MALTLLRCCQIDDAGLRTGLCYSDGRADCASKISVATFDGPVGATVGDANDFWHFQWRRANLRKRVWLEKRIKGGAESFFLVPRDYADGNFYDWLGLHYSNT